VILLASLPIEIDREEARQRAVEELSKRAYAEARPGLFERALLWLSERLEELIDGARTLSPAGGLAVLVLLLLLVAVVVLVRRRIGPLARAGAQDTALFLGRERTAAEHRRAADAHAKDGEWPEAVRERLRAIVRDLEERGLLDPRPGRTSLEAAAEGGLALPSCAPDLRAGAELFDDVWYGGRPADERSDAMLRALDVRVRAARPEPMLAASAAGSAAQPVAPR
jgi:hypothetical protein